MADIHKALKGVRAINKALKGGSKRFRGKRYGRGKIVKPPAVKPQKCIVKTAYSKHTGTGNWQAHGKYIEREGAQNENEIGKGFGSDGDNIHISKLVAEWEKAKDPHMFKFIISPEFGEKLDMQAYCKELVANMEKDLDCKLQWVAIDHNNTDNPHVHLLVRGITQDKEPLFIDQQYIKEGCRNRAIGILNKELGPRDFFYEKEAFERQVTQKRFTTIDRQISRGCENGVFSFTENGEIKKWQRTKEQQDMRMLLIRRMKQLEALGLAERVGNLDWKVDPELNKKLRDIAIRENREGIFKEKKQFFSNADIELVHTQLKQVNDRVVGKLVSTGFDPETDLPYILLEGVDGKAHFVYQNKAIEKERGDDLKTGDVISVQVNEFEKNGKKIKFSKIENYGTMKEITENKSFIKDTAFYMVEQNLLKEKVAGFNTYVRQGVDNYIKNLEKVGLVEKDGDAVKFVNPSFKYNDKDVHVLSFNNKDIVAGKIVEFDHKTENASYFIVETKKGLVAVNSDFADVGLVKSKCNVEIKLQNNKFFVRKQKERDLDR